MKKIIFAVFALMITLVSCDTIKNTTSTANLSTEVAALNGSWELNYISGPKVAFEKLYPQKKPTMLIDVEKKSVSGNSGCNTYTGTLVAAEGIINFNQAFAVTKMMCAESALGETTYFEILKKVTKFSVADGNTLQLFAGNLLLMKFQKK